MFKTLKKLIRCLSIVPLMCTSMFSHNQVTYDLNSGAVKSANINVDNGFRSLNITCTNYSFDCNYPYTYTNVSLNQEDYSSYGSNYNKLVSLGYFSGSLRGYNPFLNSPSTSLTTDIDGSYQFFSHNQSYSGNDVSIFTYDLGAYLKSSMISFTSTLDISLSTPTLQEDGSYTYDIDASDIYSTSSPFCFFAYTLYYYDSSNVKKYIYQGCFYFTDVSNYTSSFVFYDNNSYFTSSSDIEHLYLDTFCHSTLFGFYPNRYSYFTFNIIPFMYGGTFLDSSNTNKQSSVDELQSNYDTLNTEYASLLEKYNNVVSLSEQYDSLLEKYNELVDSYYALYSSYSYSTWTNIFNPSRYCYLNVQNGVHELKYQPLFTRFLDKTTGQLSGAITATPTSLLQNNSGVTWLLNNNVNPLGSLYSELSSSYSNFDIAYSQVKLNPSIINIDENDSSSHKLRIYILKSTYSEVLNNEIAMPYHISFTDMNYKKLCELKGNLHKNDFSIASQFVGGSSASLGSFYYADIEIPSVSVSNIQYIYFFGKETTSSNFLICGFGVASDDIDEAYVNGYNDAFFKLSDEISSLEVSLSEAENDYMNAKAEYEKYKLKYNQDMIDAAYNQGYSKGRSSVSDEGASITTLFTSIVGVPITILNGLGVLTVWDIPLISVLLSLMFAMLLLWLIKKLI